MGKKNLHAIFLLPDHAITFCTLAKNAIGNPTETLALFLQLF